jgi:hypothetical protein
MQGQVIVKKKDLLKGNEFKDRIECIGKQNLYFIHRWE